MNSALYDAAARGDIETLKERSGSDLESQETPQKNTVLHVAVQVASARTGNESSQEKIVKAIEEICKLWPALIRRKNLKDETPLHIAARGGRSKIVEILIQECTKFDHECAKKKKNNESLLRMENLRKDTALHEALKNHHLFDGKYSSEYLQVVKLLIHEDPELTNFINDASESPAFIAAREGLMKEFMDEVLNPRCSKYGGPDDTTALHAAVLLPEAPAIAIIPKLMRRKADLIEKKDKSGMTPLHYAAKDDKKNSHQKVKTLLESLDPADKKVVHIPDKNGMTALHYAALRGANETIDELIKHRPDCFEQVDNREWTTLHFAVKGGSKSTIEHIMKNSNENLRSISMAMVNERNNDGDTPLHLAARILNFDAVNILMDIPQVDKVALNNRKETAYMIFKATDTNDIFKLIRKLDLEKRMRSNATDSDTQQDTHQDGEVHEKGSQVRETELLVATLIATVTFAAGFTIPGGYNGDGMATFIGKGTFELFLIANTAAMALSTAVIFLHLFEAIKKYSKNRTDEFTSRVYSVIIYAIFGMVIAFGTGTWLVIANNQALAIRTTILGCCFFLGGLGLVLSAVSEYLNNAFRYLFLILFPSIVFSLYALPKMFDKKSGDDRKAKLTETTNPSQSTSIGVSPESDVENPNNLNNSRHNM